MDEQKNGSRMNPIVAMLIGLVVGIMLLCTIGFFYLAGRILKTGGLAALYAPAQNSIVAQQPAAQQPDQGAQPTPSKVNVAVGHFPALGRSTAPVTVIEFADFRCPFCQRFYQETEKSIVKDYVNKGLVKYAFRHFAFLGQPSNWAGEAAECANEQGKFWQMHNWLYENQAPESDQNYYSKQNLISYAGKLGLNVGKFTLCLNTDKYASAVSSDTSDGQTAGVNGTPTTFVNGKPIVGAQPYSVVKAAIDQALQGG